MLGDWDWEGDAAASGQDAGHEPCLASNRCGQSERSGGMCGDGRMCAGTRGRENDDDTANHIAERML